MDFGRVETLEGIDLSLPPDHPRTEQVLGGSKKSLNVYAGCAKWGRKEWVGLLYPKGTPERDFLKHYVTYFNSIELNATMYRVPNAATVRGWADTAPSGFRFCPKVNQSISHRRRLRGAQGETKYFCDVMINFGEKLGPALLLLPHNFTVKNCDDLIGFINEFPRDIPLAVEWRHKSWFEESDETKRAFDAMEEAKIISVITDTAGRRDALHMRLTTSSAFIRFQGYDLHPTDYTRIDEWVERITLWTENGLETLYWFAHQDNEFHTPGTCAYFVRKVNEKLGAALREPGLIS